MFVLGLTIGLFVGFTGGIFMISLCKAASDRDNNIIITKDDN